MRHSTKYLYGDLDPIVLETQKSVARAKLKACSKLLEELLSVPYQAQDDEHIKAVVEAREFNNKILEEGE